ncbi:DUF4386 domain-containing protein [Arthrobacter bambusae]|uniref:DUF4386 domain-containing protein n=1 Tax=Arthrobacter bambusae TaxID=1338426 RepID=A0AAW8DGT3_9MICC|nr:DUF4386 domain-containing protein [Arthrobacter bambusae]MDP9904434.1 hypothetical protein [Arthrobacter bambusae]MDQ0127570.1 hypothetical protein [Arthrobacter bambusae]MDQ0178913.1 hypothetical protein [Arthrobacter bambusae]
MNARSVGREDTPAEYEIRVKGHLDSRWDAWFEGLSVTNEHDGTAVIRTRTVDQAALHGLLQKLRDLALPLLAITQTGTTQTSRPASNARIFIPKKDHTMKTTTQTPTTDRGRMDPLRKTAMVAGILYIVTFVSSIPALFLISPVLNDPHYITGPGADSTVIFGCFLDLVNAVSAVGTAVALFPVVKRQNEGIALGFVTARMFEAAVIVIGVVSLLAVVTLRQNGGADPALVPVGQALVAVRGWTFILGPSLVPGVSGLLLGYLMYRSGLVPRIIPLLGLIGGPLLLSSTISTMFGINQGISVWSGLATLPIFVWELSLGIWMAVKGFRPSPITTGQVRTA